MKGKNVIVLILVVFSSFIHPSSQICFLIRHSNTLKCTNLKEIPKFAGDDLKAGTLKLARNSIVLVQSNAFLDFINLRYINISRNSVNRVESKSFSHKEYEWIDLSFNKLQTLVRDVFPDDKTLKTKSLKIYLHHNPWDCTCELKWMIDLIKDTLIRPLLIHPTCATPLKLKGRRLVELQDQDYCVIAECSECDDAADCVIYNNKYTCICRASYHGNGRYCADKDECAISSTNNCKANELCENFAGGYQCVCSGGFHRMNGECVDINECQPPPVGCGPGQGTCKNTLGSFQCLCNPGLKYSPSQGCIDLDECKSDSNPCKEILHSTCVNKAIIAIGDKGYSCQCDQGYIKSGEACILKDDPKRLYIIVGAGCGLFILIIILTIIIGVSRKKRARKVEEKEPEFVIAPVAMTTPIDFAFMDLPQEHAVHAEHEEWNEMDSDDSDET